MTSTFSDASHIARIAEALWAREPVGSAALLVGAGFSRNAAPVRASAGTMPGWNDIYRTMVNQLYPAPSRHREWLLGLSGATSAYLRVAEEFEAQFGRNTLDKLILANVPDRQFAPGKLHKMLVQLPWADIMTTNWDTLLERAAESAEERVYDILRTVEEIPEARAPRVIKLHGSLPSHRPFVFTEEDFRTYPARFAAFVNLAQQLAMENTLVLLGFSGDDPNFLFWSGWVRDRLGPKAPLIYLVGALDLSAAKRKMLESRRIQPIDLAKLQMFENWPESRRLENAHQWFLESLRAVEPYRAQRWPRPAAGFIPPLVHVTSVPDPRSPMPEPQLGNSITPAQTVRELVVQWRQNRAVYPGWVVPPFDTSQLLWRRLIMRIHDIIPGLRELGEDERLDALFELNWQQEVALVPLVLTVDDVIAELLDTLIGRYEQLPPEQARQFRALALAILRHAREDNDAVLYKRWSDWLAPRLAEDTEGLERLTYDNCLRLRADFDIDGLEAALNKWNVQGDSFWLLRKAALLADLGRDEEASQLSVQALNAIREQTQRGAKDIASWSRESFALLFRSSVLFGALGDWRENGPVRDRFDMRQEELQARGCPGRSDFFDLQERLAQPAPPLKQERESTRRFDLGSIYRTFNLGPLDPRVERLLAYQALRFQEEGGLPLRIGHAAVARQLVFDAARWLMDVAPTRAIDAFLRASPGSANRDFDKLFSRATIARINAGEANRLIDRVFRLIAAAKERIDAGNTEPRFWMDRLKSALDIASRVVLRTPHRAPKLLEIGLALHADPRFRRNIDLGGQLHQLVSRCFEAAEISEHDAMLLAIFEHPITKNAGDFAHGVRDPEENLPGDVKIEKPDPRWRKVVSDTTAALRQADTRLAAASRMVWLFNAKLLNKKDLQVFGAALWDPNHVEDGLPSGTAFYAGAFLSLPKPARADPQRGLCAKFLTDAQLTDADFDSGALANLLGEKQFLLDEAQLVALIERLHVYVASHAAAPAMPNLFSGNGRNLAQECARIVINLAIRARSSPMATDKLRALARLNRYPLRIEPAYPLLLDLGVVTVTAATKGLRTLIASRDETDVLILGSLLDQIYRSKACVPAFEVVVWREIAQVVAVRTPSSLTLALRFLASSMRKDPARIPAEIDDALSTGLRLILDETEMTSPVEHLHSDPFLARYFSAALVSAMDHNNRGDPAMRAAWAEAIESDPLPDTRRGRRSAS
ncbi:SIR2 family protein [Mesorhizobium sp. MSK_1335]|uniref:SIR2 family protein n=1 Tax=Mesorhizobium montanum TaxID=3072323 RepID=A0ABU4ZN31_9HYPH|nr:SIR2 family protein [Mesorhizobium sp. MSK_1335]MDX8525386.1 SIR2 family protein [Mesorhizobium sp. MSK_1335]